MTTNRNPALLAHLLLLGVVIVWGTTFSLVKAALTETSPLVFNLIRMTLAFALLAAVNLRSLRGLTRSEITLSAAAGVFLALGYQFQTVGLNYTTAAKAGFITGLVVVFVPLFSAIPGVAAKNTPLPTHDTYLGALLAFTGLILLTTPPHAGLDLISSIGLGEWLCLACAVAFAAHLLVLSRAAPRVSARRLGTLQIGFAALVMLFTLPLSYLTIQSWAQQHLPASHTALLFTLEPVFAWLTSMLFLGERLGPRSLLGAAFILAGIVIAEFRPTSRPHIPIQQAESVDPPLQID
jgi:drug/metabolite transporter (DMT)-like permease